MAPQSRFPAHVQYATASHQLTPATGREAAQGQVALAGTNEAFSWHSGIWAERIGLDDKKFEYSPHDTSVLSMQKEPATFTMSEPAVCAQSPASAASIVWLASPDASDGEGPSNGLPSDDASSDPSPPVS